MSLPSPKRPRLHSLAKSLRLEDPVVITYPLDRRSVSPSKTPKLPKFRSPYLLSNVLLKEFSPNNEVEVHLLSDSTKDTLLPSISTTSHQAEIQIPEVPLQFGRDSCPVCGFALDELESLEALSMGDVQIVNDIKFTIHCLQLLNVLASEMCTTSRMMHSKLIQQLKYAIFPQETPGVFSAVPYCTIYASIDQRKKAAEEELDETKDKLYKLTKKLSIYKEKLTDLTSQFQARDQLSTQLLEENKLLKQTVTQIQQNMSKLITDKDDKFDFLSNIQSTIEHLQSRLHLKTLEMKIQKEVYELKLEESKNEREVVVTTPTGLRQKLKEAEENLKNCSNDLDKQKRLHDIMIKSFKKQMKEMRIKLGDKIKQLEIDLDNANLKDVKKECEWPMRQELEKIIQTSVDNLSFDGLVRVCVISLKACYDIIKQQATKITHLQSFGSSLELSNLNIREQLEDLQHRVDLSFLYDVKVTTNFSRNSRYFVGLGKGLDVPKFLRANGFINYLDLKKQEVINIFNEMWTLKFKWQSHMRRPIPIQTYFYNFLRNKLSYMPRVIEYGYNMLDSAEKYSDDPDCDIFLCILKEELPEKIMNDILRMVKKFSVYMYGYTDDGLLSKAEVLEITDEFFYHKKSDDDKQVLSTVLSQDIKTFKCTENDIPVVNLFKPIPTMSTSRFIAAIKKQYLGILHRYYTSLTNFIHQHVDSDCTISCAKIVEGLCINDTNLEQAAAEKTVKHVYGQAAIDINAKVNVQIAIKKLMMAYVKPNDMYLVNLFNAES